MFKRFGLVALAVLIFALMVWFTSLNPGNVRIDLAFGVVEPTLSLALVLAFVLGWVFGLACLAFYVFRLIAERRRLRHKLSDSESELTSLRSLPIVDAD